MKPFLLGIDVGTSSVKAGVFSPDGEVRALVSVPCLPSTPQAGWAETDVRQYWAAVVAALALIRRQDSAALDDVAGVGLSVLFPGLVPLDASGRPLAPAILYCDQRSTDEVRRLSARPGFAGVERRTRNKVVPGTCSAASIAWLRRQRSDVFREAAIFGHINTYLAHRLTGQFAIDPTNASLTGLLDLAKPARFSNWLCARFGVPAEKLPPLVGCASVLGGVTRVAARAIGLRPGMPVVIGGGDAPVAAFGGALVPEKELFYAAGTTDCLMLALREPPTRPLFGNCAYCLDNQWVSIGTMTSSGAAADWFTRAFLPAGATVADLETLAFRDPAGETDGPVFLPYLQGERTPVWDPTVRGAFTGLSLAHGRGDVARAVLEGVACGVRQVVETLETVYNTPGLRIRAVGGGTANRKWMELKASVLGRPIEVLEFQECGVLGAALLAGLGAGVYSSYPAAVQATADLRRTRTVAPRVAWRERYETLYRRYTSLYPFVREWQNAAQAPAATPGNTVPARGLTPRRVSRQTHGGTGTP